MIEKVHRKPHRSAPVGVTAEEPRSRVTRIVRDTVFGTVHLHDEGMIAMEAREGPHAVRRQKLAFVEHTLEYAPQPVGMTDREQTAVGLALASDGVNVRAQIRPVRG